MTLYTAEEVKSRVREHVEHRQKVVKDLYNDLNNLVANSDAFFFSEFPHSDSVHSYRVFSYRLSSYTEFLQPSALEARGIMFELAADGTPIRIAARPPEKFFNFGENPFTMDIDWSQVEATYTKEDGSLITTFLEVHRLANGNATTTLRVKSKTSISSDQANAALAFINATPRLAKELLYWEESGYSVNCEWCAPDNRIVVGYMEPKLIVLNARDRITGEYLHDQYLKHSFKEFFHGGDETVKSEEDIERIRAKVDYEGEVVRFKKGYKIRHAKLKTDWYLTRHRTKDSVNNAGHLFDCVLHEGIDDLKSLFVGDELAMKRILDMEALVVPLFNGFVDRCETYFADNKHLDRKDFAVGAQAAFPQVGDSLNKITFAALMSLYQGRNPLYKDLLAKHKKSFITIADVEVE